MRILRAAACLLTLTACSAGSGERAARSTPSDAEAIDAASAAPGELVANVPASAPGVTTWNVYANLASDGTPTLTVAGVDGSGSLQAAAILLPGSQVAGIGTAAGASTQQAEDLAAAIANDFAPYASPGAGSTSGASAGVHLLDNPFGLSDCTYAILSAVGSVAGTVTGVVSAFATCPVTVGVGCVAGVVMTIAGAGVGVYNVSRAVQTCGTVGSCNDACNSLGTQLPTCAATAPYSSCYATCAGGDTSATDAFGSCVAGALANTGEDTGDASACAVLDACF
jgi:hypothetical protein